MVRLDEKFFLALWKYALWKYFSGKDGLAPSRKIGPFAYVCWCWFGCIRAHLGLMQSVISVGHYLLIFITLLTLSINILHAPIALPYQVGMLCLWRCSS